jgi:hypothetical protein
MDLSSQSLSQRDAQPQEPKEKEQQQKSKEKEQKANKIPSLLDLIESAKPRTQQSPCKY